jgi:hypothetical protein
MIPETLRLTLASPWEGREDGMTCLIHFTNTPLDFWLWVSQGLGGGSDLWEESFTLLWPRFDV